MQRAIKLARSILTRCGSEIQVPSLAAIAVISLLLFATLRSIASSPAHIGTFEGQTDVGVTPKQGSAAYDAARREYSVTGGGANMWGTEDAFHFLWKRASGDITLSARVFLGGSGGNSHRKAGLMVRQGLGANDAYADVLIHGDGLTALQYRQKEGMDTQEIRSEMASPAYVRLERRGNTFTFFVADEKRHFREAGSVEVQLDDPVYIGLAVCSHDADVLQTATFRNVRVQSR